MILCKCVGSSKLYLSLSLTRLFLIDKSIPKISAKISILRSLRNLVPIDTLTLNAIVLPHFDYADIVLDSASVYVLVSLELNVIETTEFFCRKRGSNELCCDIK